MKHLKLFEAEEKNKLDRFPLADKLMTTIYQTIQKQEEMLRDNFSNKHLVLYDQDRKLVRFMKCENVKIIISDAPYDDNIFFLNFMNSYQIIKIDMDGHDSEIYVLGDLLKNDLKKFAKLWRCKNKILDEESEEFLKGHEGIIKAIEIGIL